MAASVHRLIGGRRIRWDEARAGAAYADGWWVGETLADLLAKAAAAEPGRVMIVDGDVRLDAATLHIRARALAGALAARFPKGSVISFMLPNWHEAALIYFAATLSGMVINPILPSLRDHDLAFILPDVESRMIFIPAEFRGHDYAAMLGRVIAGLDRPPQVVVLRGDAGDHIAFAPLLDEASAAQPVPGEPDSVHMIMYTSGTTGRPKGVMHTHNSLHALVRQIGAHWLVDPGDTFLVPSPISHIGGSIYVFEAPLMLGCSAILMDRWDPDEGVGIIDAAGVTHLAGATPFLEALIAAARRAGSALPSLKLFICGGASVPPTLIREAKAYLAAAVVTRVYGSTEVPVTTVGVTDAADAAHAAETDGRPGIAEIRLSDVGEICARGPQMLVGYVHAEDEAQAFDADGYYRSGDQGAWVDGDYLVVTGRIKDLIIRNGENIAPKEIEDLLVQHPAIAEIAIVGIPDARTGERAVAVIVAKGPTAPDVAALKDFLDARRVARFKIPEQVAIWDSLPKNEAGKVLKHRIRSMLTE